ncbi:hypothetical protein CPC08DRAFT_770368 [Agrocybe pediades]|nr:hypothetical protein CPC08DRAFT_770368 [Agrocybe pediades]
MLCPDGSDDIGFDDMTRLALYEKKKLEDFLDVLKTYLEKLKDVGPIGNDPMAAGPTTCCVWHVTDVLNTGLDKLPHQYHATQNDPTTFAQGSTLQHEDVTHFLPSLMRSHI